MTNIVTTENGEKFTLFYTIRSPFSNFHPCHFTVLEESAGGTEQRTFSSTEQYYMYHKALSSGDFECAKLIGLEQQARRIKMLSREIKNFRQEIWREKSTDVMRRGNYAKYTQNPQLRRKLFYTHGSTLVECSPTDLFWGIGLDIDEPDALDPSKWRGKNMLGQILTEIRDDLWSKPEYAQEVADILLMLENFETFSQSFFLPPMSRMSKNVRMQPVERGLFDRSSSMSEYLNETSNNQKVQQTMGSNEVGYGDNQGTKDGKHVFSHIEDERVTAFREACDMRLLSRYKSKRRSSHYNGKRRRYSSESDSSNDGRRASKKDKSKKSNRSSGSAHERTRKRHRSRSSSKSSDFQQSSEKSCRRDSISKISDEASSSAVSISECFKGTSFDTFKNLLERLRRKTCGLWKSDID